MVTEAKPDTTETLPAPEGTSSVITPEEPKAEEQPKEQTQPSVNWEQRYKELEREKVKLQNDFRSVSTAQMKQSTRDRLLEETRDELGAVKQGLRTLQTALFATGQVPEDVTKEIENQDSQAKQTQVEKVFQKRRNVYMNDVLELITETDAEGKTVMENGQSRLLIDINSPEYANILQTWQDGDKTKDLTLFADALAQTVRLVNRTQRSKAKTQSTTKVNEPLSTEKKLDLDTGRPTATTPKPKTQRELAGLKLANRISDFEYLRLRETLPP